MSTHKEAAAKIKQARLAAVRKRFLDADKATRALRSPTLPESTDG